MSYAELSAQELLSRLHALSHSASRDIVFGGGSHKFKLNPPLSESAAIDFERRHAVVLPRDYRWFITQVGNGGAGPHYGVFKLGEFDDGAWQAKWSMFGDLSEPFPHIQAWNDLSGKPTPPSESMTQEEEDAVQAKVDEWRNDRYWHGRLVNGAIPISHLGCALRAWLVITGSEAGHIWRDDRADEQGLYPLQIPGRLRVTFLDWYVDWLEHAEASCGISVNYCSRPVGQSLQSPLCELPHRVLAHPSRRGVLGFAEPLRRLLRFRK